MEWTGSALWGDHFYASCWKMKRSYPFQSEGVRRGNMDKKWEGPEAIKNWRNTDLGLWQFPLRQFCKRTLLILGWQGTPWDSPPAVGYLGLLLTLFFFFFLLLPHTGPKKSAGEDNFFPNIMALRSRPFICIFSLSAMIQYMSTSFIYLL